MNSLSRSLRAGIQFLAAPYYVVSGLERTSRKQLNILWSGPEEHLAYFAQRFFQSGQINSYPVGRRSLRSLDALLSRYHCQIAMVIATKNVLALAVSESDLVLPLWIECTVNIDEKHVIPKSGDIRRSVRRFKSNDYRCSMSSDAEDLHYFFDAIYLPTIRKSHGEAALPASLQDRLSQFERGDAELMKVLHEGQCIAGLIIDYRKSIPALREIGVLDGSQDLKRRGVIPSLNQYAFEYLQSKGYATASLGMSRPFLDDGVLQFKRKFGPTVSDQSEHNLLIRVAETTAGVRSMLCASPCFSLKDGKLTRTFFQDTGYDTTLAVKQNSLLSWDFGIEAMRIVDLSEGLPSASGRGSEHMQRA